MMISLPSSTPTPHHQLPLKRDWPRTEMASYDADPLPPPHGHSHISPFENSASPGTPPQENWSRERGRPSPPRDRIILVNRLTQDTVVVDPSSPPPPIWGPLLRALQAGEDGGPPPASRESVRAMREVIKRRTSERGREEEEEQEECVICMEEFEEGREMPCGHRFHGGCIERWLGIHGTCPVCRHQMPADEVAAARKGWEDDDDDDDDGGGEDRNIWISFSVRRRNSSSEIIPHHHHYWTDSA